MKKIKVSCVFLSLLMMIFAASSIVMPVSASEGSSENTETVKVGIFAYPQYAELDENGIWTGYDAEMTDTIAQAAGLVLEYVPVESMEEGSAELTDGTLDILCDITKTPDREEQFLFSDMEQGSTSVNIDVKKDNDAISYGDAEQLSKLKYAAVADSSSISLYQSWCENHGFVPDIHVYKTPDEALQSLDKGEVDAAVLTDDSAAGGKLRSVLAFGKTPYYYMFRKDNMELKNKIDVAAAIIFTQNPLYEQTLKQKYGINNGDTISLTKEEKEYVASHPQMTVAVVEHDEPYFNTGSEGKAEGILPDLYEKIAGYTGMNFTFRAYASQQDAIDAVLDGEADILGIFSDGVPYASSAGLRLTSAYSSVNLVMIERAGTDSENIRKIAVKKRSLDAVKKSAHISAEDAEFVGCASAGDCFNALKQKQADALIVALPSATWIINQTNSSAYSFVPLSGTGIELNAAVASDNSQLENILNKGIRQSSDLFNGIVSNNTGSENSLQAIVSRIPASVIVAVAAVLAFMVIFLIWAVISLVKSRKAQVAAVQAGAAAEEQRIKMEAIEKNVEEKNAFFSNISHDMRTPLNGILGFAELAEKQESLEKARLYIAKIKRSGKLLLGLINDTLTISKIGSGKLDLKPEPVDTSIITEGITDSIYSLAAQKGVDFIVDDTGLRRRIVYADKLNLEKIFLNLLSNAVKFTPEGGHVRFTVRDDPRTGVDPDIVVSIRDDGIGMSEVYLQHMYEPFSQEKRHGYDSVGTGLGLAIVKQLVELMGGSIEAKSQVNEGTSVTVRLHLQEAEAVKIQEKTSDTDEAFPALDGLKILLCEDNILNREIAAALLKEKHVTVAAAENGQSGVELFSESMPGEFAAILMDIRMPVMDGIEAAKAVRAMDRSDAKTIPVIAMTADAFDEDVRRCMDAGMNGHIAKPVDPDQLYKILEDAVLKEK